MRRDTGFDAGVAAGGAAGGGAGETAASRSHGRMIGRALAALEEAAYAAEHGRVVRTWSVQLLLALLFDCSDGDAAPYHAFLRHACSDAGDDAGAMARDRRARGAAAHAAWRGIAHGVGRGQCLPLRHLANDDPRDAGDPAANDVAPPVTVIA